MAPILRVGLPCSGVIRNIARELRHGPIEDQGLGIHDIYVTMNLKKLQYLLHYGTFQHRPGPLIEITLAGMQLEVGCKQQVLNTNFQQYGALATRSWIKGLWEWLSDSKFVMEGPASQNWLISTEDDTIIDWCIKQRYNGERLKCINKCRMFLKVITLRDLMTVDGKQLNSSALQRERP